MTIEFKELRKEWLPNQACHGCGKGQEDLIFTRLPYPDSKHRGYTWALCKSCAEEVAKRYWDWVEDKPETWGGRRESGVMSRQCEMDWQR